MRTVLADASVLLVLASADASADARHIRIETRHHGPIHVWVPDGYDPAHAGVVVYVHGYFADVDDAWKEYNLASQFARSRLDAVFIAPEAPTSPRDGVSWSSLSDLLACVEDKTDIELPDGPLVAVGHSAAHRTLTEWLDDGQLDTVVLLDALYGEVDEMKSWLDASDDHRLIDVSQITRPWAEQLHAELPETVVFDGFPTRSSGRMRDAREARVIHVRTHIGHMPLVTGGRALPQALRALRMPLVKRTRER
jgi:hypothetical protein